MMRWMTTIFVHIFCHPGFISGSRFLAQVYFIRMPSSNFIIHIFDRRGIRVSNTCHFISSSAIPACRQAGEFRIPKSFLPARH
jgi:hypothetical protein